MKRMVMLLAALVAAAVAAPIASANHDPLDTDRHFWLCYAVGQTDPGVYSRGLATALFAPGFGYTVPIAVREPLSSTAIGNGMYLTCTLPAGYTVVDGAAVSTGGGELITDASVDELLEMRLDYTRLAAVRP